MSDEQKIDPNSTFVDLHGHRIVSKPDPMAGQKEALERNVRAKNATLKEGETPVEFPPHDGWLHELFPFTDAEFDGAKWTGKTLGPSLGNFPTLGLALAEAKKRNPYPVEQPDAEETHVAA